jgi:hypothetical protein
MNTGPRILLGHRREVGLALSSIRVGLKHTLYDNIVSRYELLCKASSLLVVARLVTESSPASS